MDINELNQAYLNTNYTIHKNLIFKEELILNINKEADFKNVLPELKEWAFITAWNPNSIELTKQENEQRNACQMRHTQLRRSRSNDENSNRKVWKL